MTLLIKTHSVKEIAEFVQARVLGDETVHVTGIASVKSAVPGDLIFVDDGKNLRPALESRASAVIVGDFAVGEAKTKPLLLVTHPRLAFARAAHFLCPRMARKPGVHASAIVHPPAQLADGV